MAKREKGGGEKSRPLGDRKGIRTVGCGVGGRYKRKRKKRTVTWKEARMVVARMHSAAFRKHLPEALLTSRGDLHEFEEMRLIGCGAVFIPLFVLNR